MKINISTKTIKYNSSYNLCKLFNKISFYYKIFGIHNFINLKSLKKLIR